MKTNEKAERKEAFMRILVLIVSGIIGYFWSMLAGLLALINWFHALILGKRNRALAEFVEYYNTFAYNFARYLSGVNNERPFPFTNLNRMSKFK